MPVVTPPLAPLQGTLWNAAAAQGAPAIAPLTSRLERHQLDPCCWVDVAPRWFAGADDLLATLLENLSWTQGQRLLWGEFRTEPRLSATAELDDPALPDLVRTLASRLDDHYQRPFEHVFCNYYRDGQDSVAWHADRIGRSQVDPLVAIICLGGPRPFRMRPMGGGTAQSFLLGSGDLLIMGGATQHHWEHGVPKMRYAPPRMSVTIRSSREPLAAGLSGPTPSAGSSGGGQSSR